MAKAIKLSEEKRRIYSGEQGKRRSFLEKELVSLYGAAWGLAAQNSDCQDGPLAFKRSLILKNFLKKHPHINWETILSKRLPAIADIKNSYTEIAYLSAQLAKHISHCIQDKRQFCVIGGDHSCAIGTWSGVHLAYPRKKLGLIWIDAHLDAHTPETSESGNIHGMPVATLLGYGHPALTSIGQSAMQGAHKPKILPENIAYIGIRSFENGEQEFIEQLGIRVYYMQEVSKRGFKEVFNEAYEAIAPNVNIMGLSVDLDGFAPEEVPGTGIHEPHGINPQEFCHTLAELKLQKPWVGLEIAEFNPYRDEEHKTIFWMQQILQAVFQIA